MTAKVKDINIESESINCKILLRCSLFQEMILYRQKVITVFVLTSAHAPNETHPGRFQKTCA